jgi:hypothetical protein
MRLRLRPPPLEQKSLFRRAELRRFNNQNDSEINANGGQGTTRTFFFVLVHNLNEVELKPLS